MNASQKKYTPDIQANTMPSELSSHLKGILLHDYSIKPLGILD